MLLLIKSSPKTGGSANLKEKKLRGKETWFPGEKDRKTKKVNLLKERGDQVAGISVRLVRALKDPGGVMKKKGEKTIE